MEEPAEVEIEIDDSVYRGLLIMVANEKNVAPKDVVKKDIDDFCNKVLREYIAMLESKDKSTTQLLQE